MGEDDGDRFRIRAFRRGESASEKRLDPDDREIFLGHILRDQLFRIAAAGEVGARLRVAGEAGEGLRALLPAKKIGRRDDVGLAGLLGVGLPDGDDAVRVAIGQLLEKNGVNDGEDGAVRADPEGKREDGEETEAGRFAQLAESEAKVG